MTKTRTYRMDHRFGGGGIVAVSLLFQLGCDRAATEKVALRSAPEELASSAVVASPVALGLAAKKLGTAPENVVLGDPQTLSLPLTGKGPIIRQKAHALVAGQLVTVGVAIDNRGNEVDADSLVAAEEAAQRAKYGKKTVGLYDRIQLAPAGPKIQVSFWLHVPDSDMVFQTEPPVGDGAHNQHD